MQEYQNTVFAALPRDYSYSRPASNLLTSCTGCVWDVAWLPDGDLVSACADYVARVWTSSTERAASAETVAGLAVALEAKQQPKQGQGEQAGAGAGLPAGLKMEEASVLGQPGKKDGEIKVVNEGGAGIAYSWDAAR